MLEKANKIRLFNAMKNKYFLYEVINKNHGLTIYDLAKKVNWSSGKVNHYIQKLLKDKVIENSTEIDNGKVKKHYSPVSYKEFINWDEIKELKTPPNINK